MRPHHAISLLSLPTIGFLTALLAFKPSLAQAAKPDRGGQIQLLSSSPHSTVIRVTVDDFDQKIVRTPIGDSFVFRTGRGASPLKAGEPDLGTLATTLIIPDQARMNVRILSSEFEEVPNVRVAPSKGEISRKVDPSTVPYVYGDSYGKDEFYPTTLAELQRPFILRDYRGQTITISPFQYNPQTDTLRVYREIVVEFSVADQNGENPLFRRRAPETASREFMGTYERLFLNYPKRSDDPPISERGSYLVITAEEFAAEIEPFVAWKKQKGIRTTVEEISSIGNSVEKIKKRVCDGYANDGLKFVLLVGDFEHITSEKLRAGVADPTYGYCDGDDHIAEVMIGRLSGENPEHIRTQVDKILHYEKNLTLGDSSWLQRGFVMGSNDSTKNHWNETDWSHCRNRLRKVLLEGGDYYTDLAELYDGSQGGEDAPGKPKAKDTIAQYDRGIGIFFYSGHAFHKSLGTGGLSKDVAIELTNGEQKAWPHTWVLGCNPGEFNGKTCVAENMLRASGGSLSAIASSMSQPWNPPYLPQMEWVEMLTDQWQSKLWTIGGIASNGYIAMVEEYPRQLQVADTWITFGDPSMIVHTSALKEMVVDHQEIISLGATEFEVNIDTEGALIALSNKGEILATQYANGTDPSILALDSPIEMDSELILTITAKNKVTYIVELPVEEDNGEESSDEGTSDESTGGDEEGDSSGDGDDDDDSDDSADADDDDDDDEDDNDAESSGSNKSSGDEDEDSEDDSTSKKSSSVQDASATGGCSVAATPKGASGGSSWVRLAGLALFGWGVFFRRRKR